MTSAYTLVPPEGVEPSQIDLEGRSRVPPGRGHGDGGGCRTLEHGFAIRGARRSAPSFCR